MDTGFAATLELFCSLDQEIQVVIDGETYTLTYELGAEKTWVSKFTEVLNNTTGARIFQSKRC